MFYNSVFFMIFPFHLVLIAPVSGHLPGGQRGRGPLALRSAHADHPGAPGPLRRHAHIQVDELFFDLWSLMCHVVSLDVCCWSLVFDAVCQVVSLVVR